MKQQRLQVAFLLDFENLAISLENQTNNGEDRPFSVAKALAFVEEHCGSVGYRKAFADWSVPTFKKYVDDLQKNGVDMQHVSRIGHNGKSPTDIHLVLDSMVCALHQPHIECYVVATGNADFLPLITRLKALGKQVVGLGVEGSISSILEQNCDEYIHCTTTDFYFKKKTAAVQAEAQASVGDERVRRITDAGPVISALRHIFRNDEEIPIEEVEEEIHEIIDDFSPQKFGFESFGELLHTLGNFIEMQEEDGEIFISWTGPVIEKEEEEGKDANLSFADYMQATRWFLADGGKRDEILQTIFEELSNLQPQTSEELRKVVDREGVMTDKQWSGTLYSLKCGGALYEHPENGKVAAEKRRLSLFRNLPDENEFVKRYYVSLFHKAAKDREDLTLEKCLELLYETPGEEQEELLREVIGRLEKNERR